MLKCQSLTQEASNDRHAVIGVRQGGGDGAAAGRAHQLRQPDGPHRIHGLPPVFPRFHARAAAEVAQAYLRAMANPVTGRVLKLHKTDS